MLHTWKHLSSIWRLYFEIILKDYIISTDLFIKQRRDRREDEKKIDDKSDKLAARSK